MQKYYSSIPPFQELYDIVFSKGVWLLSEHERYKVLELSRSMDLIVHQPVIHYPPANSRDIVECAKNAKVISFPVPYFDGYFPDISYIRDLSGKIVHEPIDYHSRLVLAAYLGGLSLQDVVRMFTSASSVISIPGAAERSLTELSSREFELDIQISEYIKKHYQKKQLFFSQNHPNAELMFFIINAVLEILELPELSEKFKSQHSYAFMENQWPIRASTKKELGLEFHSSIVIEGKELTIQQFVEMYYQYYERNPEVVVHNKDLAREYLELILG